ERPTIEALQIHNHYSLEEAKRYLRAYDMVVGTPQEQEQEQGQRKAKNAGSEIAYRGGIRPTIQTLLKRYTEEEAEIYLDAYDKAAETTTDIQAFRRERKLKKIGEACAILP
ncbi:MAG TPA: hypothetical protein PLD88_05800, partial [Candidatus Berkiella sp.]|nr:hypothetical protein [Candidatus Berkiella sp.]